MSGRGVNPKSAPGRRQPQMLEQTMARVRKERDALLALKRSGGGALQTALGNIINQECGFRVSSGISSALSGVGCTPAASCGGSGGGGGGGESACWGGRRGGGMGGGGRGSGGDGAHQESDGAASYSDDCFDGLSADERIDLLLRLQAVLEEEERLAAGGAQLEEQEAWERAHLEYLSRQAESDGEGGGGAQAASSSSSSSAAMEEG